MFGYKLVKVEKPEKEKTEAKTETTEEKGEKKKMTKKGKIAAGLAIATGVIGAAAFGAKKYIDSQKESDGYAELNRDTDEADDIEDLDQEETTEEETN